jgi:hypothetical protein
MPFEDKNILSVARTRMLMKSKKLGAPLKAVGNRSFFLSITLPVLALVAGVGVTFGVWQMRSATPFVNRASLQVVNWNPAR